MSKRIYDCVRVILLLFAAAGLGTCVNSMIAATEAGKRTSSTNFRKELQEWAEHARTNATVETHLSFMENVVLPFLRRAIPDPFAAGGPEADKPWSDEGRKVHEELLWIVGGEESSAWYGEDELTQRAERLVGGGCADPLVRIYAALACKSDKEAMRKRYEELEAELKGRKRSGFLRMLLSYQRTRCGKVDGRDSHWTRFIDWLKSEAFTPDDEMAIFHLTETFLSSTFAFTASEVFERFPWAAKIIEVRETMNEARRVAGGGVAASVSGEGWRKLEENTSWALNGLAEADGIRSNRIETARYSLWVAGESRRRVSPEHLWTAFRAASNLQLDDPEFLDYFIWYRLYPRWSNCRGHADMLAFADACLATGRHDTMLPYLYAELQCRYVRDAQLDPRRYFREHPDIADRCIDVCLRQMTNRCVSTHVRLLAPSVAAYVAYNAGRYEMTNLFSRLDWYRHTTWQHERIFPDREAVQTLYALGGRYAEFCRKMQLLYDERRHEAVLAEYEQAPREFFDDGGPREETQFVGALAANARMKLDFSAGMDVPAIAWSRYLGWFSHGWRRCGERVWDTYDRNCRFGWSQGLTWRVELPWKHELEFRLEPKPKTEGRHVLVVSRFIHERSHYRPINGIPFMTFVWEKGRMGLIVSSDYYQMFKIDPRTIQWIETPEDSRRIRIRCNGQEIAIFIGEAMKPTWSSSVYASAMKRANPIGYARFRGENVRLSDIIVRPVGE